MPEDIVAETSRRCYLPKWKDWFGHAVIEELDEEDDAETEHGDGEQALGSSETESEVSSFVVRDEETTDSQGDYEGRSSSELPSSDMEEDE